MSTRGDHSKTPFHVVMFPFFAFGHVSPFAQLSNKLSSHGVRVTFLSTPGIIERIKSSQILADRVVMIPLTVPSVEGLPPGLDSTSDATPDVAEHLKTALNLMEPQVRSLMIQLKPQFLMYDFAHTWIPKLGSEIGFKSLFFTVFTAIANAYIMAPARTSEGKVPTAEDLTKPPTGLSSAAVKSMKMFQCQDFTFVFKRFNGKLGAFDMFLQSMNECSAVVMKTSYEMEAAYVDYMKSQFQKPALLTGPLVPNFPSSGILAKKWANWLAKFPPKSVIFCIFGSETFLTDDQIKELALGLELTNSPFILVLNFPRGLDKQAELDRALPTGFLERVNGRGIISTEWVSQTHILASDRVGCLFSHAGFSTLVEGLANDCELVLLPMKGDQFLNSKLVSEDWRAGVEVHRRDEDGYFSKDDVYQAVKTVMIEGDKEPGFSNRTNRRKWSQFMLNRELHDKFIANMVEEMKAMA